MSDKRRKGGFFGRLLALYMSAILLPILCLFFLLIRNSSNALIEANMDSAADKLSSVQNLLESAVSELDSIGAMARYNTLLRPSYRDMDSYSDVEIVNELTKYRQLNASLTEVYLVYEDSVTVYSSEGTMKRGLFIGSVVPELIDDSTALFTDKPYFASSEWNECIAYVYPMSGGGTTRSSIVFLLDRGNLFEICEVLCTGNADAGIAVFSSNGNALAEAGRLPETKRVYELVIERSSNSFRSKNIGGESYSGATCRTSFGWTLIMTSRDNNSFWNVCIKEQFAALTGFALLVVGFIVALRLALSQSKPLNRIAGMYREDGTDRASFRKLADRIEENRAMLLCQLESHKQLSSAQFVTMLFLVNSAFTYDRITKMAAGLSMPENGSFCVLYLHTGGNRDAENCREHINGLKCRSASAIAVPVNNVSDTGILLYRDAQEGSDEDIVQLIDAVKQATETGTKNEYTLGQGDFCHNLLKIGQSFSQAQIAADYRINYPEQRFITYASVKNDPEGYEWHHLGDIVRFCDSIRKKQKSSAKDLLITLIDDIRSVNQKPIIVRSMCGELVIHFIRTVSEMQTDCSAYMYLFQFTSLNSLEKNMLAAIDEVCSEPDETEKTMYYGLYRTILDYVTENLCSADLSLDKVAESLDYSKTHISRVIREASGHTFSDLVAEMRIEYVCERLRRTDLPINEIVTSVGYYDQSSFTRKFKKIVGVTPGEYRKNTYSE